MPDFYDPRVAELEEIGDAPLTRFNGRRNSEVIS